MPSHLERLNLFLADAPEDFLRDVTGRLEKLYLSTFEQTSELPKDYQRYLRPHLLRTQAEIALLTAARRHGLASHTRKNRSEDAHALILTEQFAMTLSRTDGPTEPPRWARFRVDYSKVATFPLPGPDFVREQPTVAVREDEPRLFVVIAHGPKGGQWRDLGFVYANFLSTDGMSYTGAGIDLMARFAVSAPDHAVEEVREPEFGFEVNEGTGEGSDR